MKTKKKINLKQGIKIINLSDKNETKEHEDTEITPTPPDKNSNKLDPFKKIKQMQDKVNHVSYPREKSKEPEHHKPEK